MRFCQKLCRRLGRQDVYIAGCIAERKRLEPLVKPEHRQRSVGGYLNGGLFRHFDLMNGTIKKLQGDFHIRCQFPAGLGQFKVSPVAGKQRRSQPLFQSVNAFAYSGLGHKQRVGCVRQAFAASGGMEE